MEGKALLFKLFGGVDAIPLCIRTRESEDIVRAVQLIEPSFGGVNLEDIAQPKCFAVLDEAAGGYQFRFGMIISKAPPRRFALPSSTEGNWQGSAWAASPATLSTSARLRT